VVSSSFIKLFSLDYAGFYRFLDIYENLIEIIISCGSSKKFGQLLNKFSQPCYEKSVLFWHISREDFQFAHV